MMNKQYIRCVELKKNQTAVCPFGGNGVLHDERYGLYWEIKSSDEQAFQFAGRQFSRKEFYLDYIQKLNEMRFGGYADWRVPLQAELKTLLDYSRTAPAFDSAAFDFLRHGEYWCGPFESGRRSDVGWIVHLNIGSATLRHETLPAYGLAVRGECRLTQPDRFIDNGDGTVTDRATGLMWQQAQNERLSYLAVMELLKNYELAAYRDWRLPTMQELTTIFDESCEDGSWYYNRFFECDRLKPPVLQHLTSDIFEDSYVWVKNFLFGYDGYYAEKTMPLCWRLVRDARTDAAPSFRLPESGQRAVFTPSGERTQQKRQGSCASFRFREVASGILDENTGLCYAVPRSDGDALFTYDEAVQYVKKLNEASYGGRGDWRLPCCDELRMIVDYSGGVIAAPLPLQNHLVAAFYWTGDAHAVKSDMAWAFYMGYGCVVPLHKQQRYRLLPVSGGYVKLADKPLSRYRIEEATVTDTYIGRMWLRHELSPMTVQEAESYLKEQRPAGFADWRLPDMKELSTLVCREYPNGAWFYDQLFPDLKNAGGMFILAAETFNGVFNWGVNLKFGYDGYYADRQCGRYLIKPVRNV